MPRCGVQAFRVLSKALQTLPETVNHRVPPNIVQYIYRVCLDDDMDVWLRSEAVTLVARLNPQQFEGVVQQLFTDNPTADLFLRSKVAAIICSQPYSPAMMAKLYSDPSDHVRQTVARQCIEQEPEPRMTALRLLIHQDPCAKVRAAAYLTLIDCIDMQEQARELQGQAFESEEDEFALKVLLYSLPQCAERWLAGAAYFAQANQWIDSLRQRTTSVGLNRFAAAVQEHLWFLAQPAWLDDKIRQKVEHLPLQRKLRLALPKDVDKEDFCRYLGFIGSERYGYDIVEQRRSLVLRAGFRFGFRFWRFWHELINPATDKRQNHNHLKGRLYDGLVQTTTRRMAELSKTKVPGEPLFISEEQGWREYLPLPDMLIASLDQGWPTKPVKLYSAEGITEIMPPKSFFKRLYARTVLQFKFSQLAALRNWQSSDSHLPDTYAKALTNLGFSLSVRGYQDRTLREQPLDPQVQRFFPTLGVGLSLPTLSDAQNYFYSVYQNTIGQLIAFAVAGTGAYFVAHITRLVQMRQARKQIPLVIGGWGTRGKSGTERLKAALFNSMGLSVVSKTTGCEAMFLYGPANRPAKELFLFRPYDKASIWEQVNLTQLTAKLKADVFLWECMGLTPRYIEIIQNQWMRDDIATITNCYPDHEDLQGPAGYEIPTVMQRFVPNNSELVTSEESMLPLLQDAARAKNTKLSTVSWLDAGLLTDDVINRFPYEEHPNNIALVAKLGERLGVDRDFSLKAMADNVVADLGVLKIYPIAEVAGRKLAFINGMSANERLGAMGNWQRTGLAGHTREDNPDIWTAIVINNRADRIARSQVFAAMLVNDTQADCYYFIGNNLNGLNNYIEQAWDVFASALKVESVEQLTALATKFRLPVSESQVLKRIRAAMEGMAAPQNWLEAIPQTLDSQTIENWRLPEVEGLDNQAIESLLSKDGANYLAYQQQCQDLDQVKAIEWLWQGFKNQWVVIENYYSTGNQTVNTIVQNTPPGLTARVIGMQNIKGTGLDFIYRWQAWDVVYQHCQTLKTSRDQQAMEEAAKSLSSWEEFGLLDENQVQTMLATAKDRPETQRELLQAELALIGKRLDTQLTAIRTSLGSEEGGQTSWLKTAGDKVLDILEAFLDAGDAIKRRRTADKIYQALLDNLISYDKATAELAKLTKAQKGGWLAPAIKKRFK